VRKQGGSTNIFCSESKAAATNIFCSESKAAATIRWGLIDPPFLKSI